MVCDLLNMAMGRPPIFLLLPKEPESNLTIAGCQLLILRLIRHRMWSIDDGSSAEDYCEYRLFFPAELEHLLAGKGFTTVGMFDNMELLDNDLSGERLYVAAKYRTSRN